MIYILLTGWYGIIFVRQGIYQEGIFRFKIIIPENYPDGDCPVIIKVIYQSHKSTLLQSIVVLNFIIFLSLYYFSTESVL